MDHDAAYYDFRIGSTVDLNAADAAFGACSRPTGPLGRVFAGAVSLNRHFRSNSPSPAGDFEMSKPKLRGSSAAKPQKTKTSTTTHKELGGQQISAPNAISNVFTSIPTRTRSIKDGIQVSGREFIATVEGNGVSSFGLGKSALLSPSFFYGGVLGQLARSYAKYKWSKLVVHYIPKVSTTAIGQIVMCSNENVTFPGPVPEAAAFLSRALVSGNGVMAPLWAPCKMQIPTDNRFRYVDAFTNVDINENVLCELLVYTQISVSAQVGYLWLEYECELKHNMLEPHSTSLPILTGTGQRVSLIHNSAAPTSNNAVQLQDVASTLSAQPFGTVYRFVVDLAGSIAPTGTTFANMWKVAVQGQTVSGTFSSNYTANAVVGGAVYYLLVASTTNMYVFTSIEAAVAGAATGQIYTNATGTSTGGIVGDATIVRLGVGILEDIQ